MARKNLIKDIKESVENFLDTHEDLCNEFEKWALIKGFEVDWPGIYPHIKGHGIEWTVDINLWHTIYDQPKKYFRNYIKERDERIQRKLKQEREAELIRTYAKLSIELCKHYGDSSNNAIWMYKEEGVSISNNRTIERISIKKRNWGVDQLHVEYTFLEEAGKLTGNDYKLIYEGFKAFAKEKHARLIQRIKEIKYLKIGGWVRLRKNDTTTCKKCVLKNLDIILEHTEARKGDYFVDYIWHEGERKNNEWFCPKCEPTFLKVGKKTVTIGKTEYRLKGKKDWHVVEGFAYKPDTGIL